ncbi:meiosis 1 arrest protein-like, partial [Stegodyphus dumicola]|uniref:meiosis 1 arrest protein-like n=1 Tax=Stegodyphus dumicola TaxID=202533 RepID=UPI0015A99C97
FKSQIKTSFILAPTRCWKLDWDELEQNQKRFSSVIRYLQEQDSVLLAKKHAPHTTPAEKTLPTGFFVFFPAREALLIKSIAVNELLLPFSEIPGKETPNGTEQEIRECLESLEQKDIYNPLSVTCGLYSYLSSTISRSKARPNTSFVVPIMTGNTEKSNTKKKKCSIAPVAEVVSTKGIGTLYGNDFLAASELIKKRFKSFPDQFE